MIIDHTPNFLAIALLGMVALMTAFALTGAPIAILAAVALLGYTWGGFFHPA